MKQFVLFFAIVLLGIFSLRAQTADTLENPGFERWEVAIGLPADHPEPVNWSTLKTSDNPQVNPIAPVNWMRSDTAHSGKYSIKLFNISAFGVVATGTLTNGRVHTPSDLKPNGGYIYTDTTNPLWHTVFTARPDSLAGWYLCKPKDGDQGNVMAILHTGYAQSPPKDSDSSTWIAKASFDLPGHVVGKWTRFSVPFNYYSDKTPKYILFILTSGNGTVAKAGSEAWFDDLQVIYNSTGINKHLQAKGNLKAYAYNKQLRLSLTGALPGIYKIRVLNILGQVQYQASLQNGESKTLDISLPPGLYLVQAAKGTDIMVRKVLVR